MKSITINDRQPNIDRMLEVYKIARECGIPVGLKIKNICLPYSTSVAIGESLYDYEPAMRNEYVMPEGTQLFAKYESFEDIKKRIVKAVEFWSGIESFTIQESGLVLLRTFVEKMEIKNPHVVQAIIDISEIIASMEGDSDIKAHHIAESCQYFFPND